MAREVDSREIDETALDIDRDEPHANLVADIGPLEPVDDAPLDIRQQMFRRMLAREAGTGANAPAIAAAARRAYERFAEQLTPLIGNAGVAAIYARSLHLTERNVRGLASLHASAQGDAPFALLQRSLEQQEPAAATEAAVAVLATASELLASFIGEGLTISLLREAWPDDFAGDATEETGRAAAFFGGGGTRTLS